MTRPLTALSGQTRPVEAVAPPKEFDGSIPEDYDRHLGPLLFDFSGRDMARRVERGVEGRPAPRVLEVACGTGISTEHLWRQLPSGAELVATDLSPDMLTYAESKRGELPGVSFEQAAADALPFGADTFDALACQFGIMFFEDKSAALAEFARVLKPGGVLAFSVWESHARNPVVGLSHTTIASFFETDPPGFLQLPFSYHDVDVITALVGEAGFADIGVHRVRETVRSNDAASVARGFVMGNPGVIEIRARGTADPERIVHTLAARIGEDFRATNGGDDLEFALEEITFTARCC
jgi:ubiquinone/menaquinone biosynthesis C-methylase UbiE